MPNFAGKYKLDPLLDFDEEKRNVLLLAQEPQNADDPMPLTVEDWNEAQVMFYTLMRRLGSWSSRNGATEKNVFRISEDAGNANSFRINGVGTNGDTSPFYLVAGHPAFLPTAGYVSWRAQGDPLSAWIHRRSTKLTADTLYDSAMKLVPNALVGRAIIPNINDTGGVGSSARAFNVVANGEDWVRCDISGGTDLLDAANPGDRWRMVLTTPTSGTTRTDRVYLDIYVDEKAAVAVEGDYDNDADLNQDDGGYTFEPTRRGALVQSIIVAEGRSGGYTFEPSALLASGAVNDGIYTFADADGNTHYCALIAEFSRGDPAVRTDAQYIEHDQILDKRVYAGRCAISSLRSQVASVVTQGVLTTTALAPSITGSGTTLTLGVGDVALNGDVVPFDAPPSFNKDPNTNANWIDGNTYSVYLDADRRVVVNAAGTFPAGCFKICKILGAASNNISILADLRVSAIDVLQLFKPNVAGVLEAAVKMLAHGVNAQKAGSSFTFTNEAGSAVYGYLNLSTSLALMQLIAADSNLALVLGSMGGGMSFRRPADNLIELYGDTDDAVVFDLMRTGAAIKWQRVNQINTKRVRTERVQFVEAADVDTLSAFNEPKVIPGGKMVLYEADRAPQQITTSNESGAGDPHTHTVPNKRPWYMLRGMPTFDLSTTIPAPYFAAAGGLYVGHLDLDVPRGARVTQIRLAFYDYLSNSGALEMHLYLAETNDIGINDVYDVLATKTLSCSAGYVSPGVGTQRNVDFDVPADFDWDGENVNTSKNLTVLFHLDSGDTWTNSSVADRTVSFMAAKITWSIEACGRLDTTNATPSAVFFPGA